MGILSMEDVVHGGMLSGLILSMGGSFPGVLSMGGCCPWWWWWGWRKGWGGGSCCPWGCCPWGCCPGDLVQGYLVLLPFIPNFLPNIISQLRDFHHSDNAYGGINV